MEFGLTDDQRALVAAAREFSATHLAPHYRQRDREGELHRETLRRQRDRGSTVRAPIARPSR